MKKHFIAFALGIVVTGLISFKFAYDSKKSTGEVEQYEGLYIFTDCKPVMETEYIGTVKSSFGSQYQDVRDKLIKKAKKDYPEAEALVLTLKSGGTDKCDVVKFKK